MLSLNLSSRPLRKLAASVFPKRADVYVCDKCGRDISRHFRRTQSHSWQPMGPKKYQCRCGETYLTGAIEWDNLGNSERRRRISQTLGLAVFSSIAFFLVAYFGLRLVPGLRENAVDVALAISILPFCLIQIGFWPGVIASKWRTKFVRSASSD